MPDPRQQLADAIGVFFDGWSAAQAMDAAISGNTAPPPLCPHDCAVMYGIVDSLAQSRGIELLLAHQALRLHLQRFSNGQDVLSKMLEAARNPELLLWTYKGGQAIHDIVVTKTDPLKAFLPLAEQLRIDLERTAASITADLEHPHTPHADEQAPSSTSDSPSRDVFARRPAGTAAEVNADTYSQWIAEAGQHVLARSAAIVFSILFDVERDALAFATQMLRAGHGVMLKPVDEADFTDWNVLVRTRLVPKWADISALGSKLELLAAPHNGALSAWHCLGSALEYLPTEPQRLRSRPLISDLVNSYLSHHPEFLFGRDETHPATLALTYPMKGWLIEHLGSVETYWAAILDAAKLWFHSHNAGREFTIFCTLLDAEAGTYWNENESLQAVYADFAAWKRGLNPVGMASKST